MPPPSTDERFPWARVSNLALSAAVLFAAMALARYGTYHNDTFDLAFYARTVWGLGRLDLWNPLVGADARGLHLSPALIPLALLSRVVPTVPLLLLTQAACVCGAAIPLARLAARRVGHPWAPYLTAGVYLLLPAVGSVASYEFHPSALALLPLALALDFFDDRRVRAGMISLVVAALCREDVALVAALTGLALAVRPQHRAAGLAAFAGFTAWFALWLFVIAPRYLPAHGSLQLHYGHLGSSPADIVKNLLLHPVATARAVATPARMLYLPRLLLPVAFLPLLRPRWLLPIAAPLAINLLSQFPTAVQVHSHYSVLAAPFIVAAAVHGAAQVMVTGGASSDRWGLAAVVAVCLGTLHMQHRAGVVPLIGRRCDLRELVPDARTAALSTVVDLIPNDASVRGPDYLLPHVAERPRVYRDAPPYNAADFVVLSTEHRAHHTGTQELWRNDEEQRLRNALLPRAYGVWTVVGDFIVLRRGWSPRTYARGRWVEFEPDPAVHRAHVDVGSSLAVAGWGVTPIPRGSRVTLLLVTKRAWPHDLGLEVGWGPMRPHLDRQDPERTYAFLPYDGVMLPSLTRVGEVSRAVVDVPATPDELRAQGLWFGARRMDGSRLDPEAPHWVRLP